MAYSSARATLGGSDVRKTTRQTRKKAPAPVTVNAVTGGAGVRRVTRQTSGGGSTSAPVSTSSAGTATRTRSGAAARRARAAARQEAQAERTIKRIIRKQPERLERALTKRTTELAKKTDTATRPKVELGDRNRVTRKTIELKPKMAKKIVTASPKQAKVKIARKLIKTSGAAPPPALARAAGTRTRRAPAKRAASRRSQSEQRRVRRLRSKLTKAAKKSVGGLEKKLDRPFGPTETITPRQTAIVAEAHGLPGITYAKAIVPGESGHKPGIPNPDDATPSLFQITPSVQSAATQAKFDRIAAKHPGGYSNPIAAAKQARVLAKGKADAGVSNYVAFNPSAPQGHLPGGQKAARRKLYGDPKPIPKPLKRKAKKVLGPQKTKKVIERAKTPPSTVPKQKAGKWGGAQRAVLSVIPKAARAEGRSDKRTPAENASVGGSSESDHLTTNSGAYAADLPADDALARKIATKLGMASHTGTNEVTKNGYRYQLIWQDSGHYDHIHLGARWVGAGAPSTAPISTGGITTGGTSAASTGTGATVTATSPMTAKQARKRRAKRMDGRARSKLIRELIANAPAPIPTVEATRTTPAEQPVTLGIT